MPTDSGGPILPAYIPAGRLCPVVNDWLAADPAHSLKLLARQTGVAERSLRALARERSVVRFDTADRIVTTIDVWLWHVGPPAGLADLYAADYAAGPGVDGPLRSIERKRPGGVGAPPARQQEVTS